MKKMDPDRAFNVTHREYIGDILTSSSNTNSLSSFQLQAFYINPGNAGLFPWLSTVASQFTNFRVRAITFTFVSTSATALNSTNTALGLALARQQYDSTVPPDTTEYQMLNSYGKKQANPSVSWSFNVDVSRMATAIGTVSTITSPSGLPANQDSRLFYPNGFFEIATIGMQANNVNIGQLHVSYSIDLFRPTLIQGEIGNTLRTAHYKSTTTDFANATPLGNNVLPVTSGVDGIGIVITSTSVTLPVSIVTGKYLMIVNWRGTGAVSWTGPVVTVTNGTVQNVWDTNSSAALGPQLSATCAQCVLAFIFNVNAPGTTQCVVNFGTSGTLPTTPTTIDVYVTQVNGQTN